MELKRIYSTSVIIVICAIIATIQAASAAPTMSVEPSYISVLQGDTFTVNITVDPDGTEISGADYILSFNNSALRALCQNKGPFLGGNIVADEIDNPNGKIYYGEYRTGSGGVTTSGTLATIGFEVRCSCASELCFEDYILGDPDGKEIQDVIINNATIGIAQSQPSTLFLIGGYVFNDGGSDCNYPAVNVTNLNTSEEWTADKDASSNYYQLTLLSCADVIAGDILRFDAASSDESQSSVTEHTVTQDGVNSGGIFGFNITLASIDTTPPASITNLQNTTYEQTCINWTWTDPDDADFAKVMVYLDGTYKENVLKEVQCYNATGLTPDTEYTIGTRTVDDLGNINDTWENDTARTKPSPDTTPPASITNLQNTTYEQTCINWAWADPGDTDFAKVMVYLDGTHEEDVLKEVQCYNATGLTPDTEYTIGTRTVDDLGNINDTWENDTARTKPSPDTTPPASITNLQNTTYEQTCINWTWTDPDDADFAKVMVYLDGTYKEGVLKEVQCYNATGLTPDTEYTIGTRTVDDLGNINDTWENDTARTKPSPDTTPPASITNLQNTTYEQTCINWAWADPGDTDFAKVMVYLDGTHEEDVLKEVQCYNATGLTPDTEYTIGTRTVDDLGNINDTWENDTARTKPSPDTTPPASITNLQNMTYEQTCINWTWTDPGDTDFAKVMVYLDGTHEEDVLKEVQCYNATGLTPDTEYTIGTRTVDDLGNINDTWENDTARTKPSPDTTPPASITNLQNTTYEQTCINWTWTDPDDADFAKVMVYLDGTYKEGVLKEVQCYNATGLTPDTEYTIGTRTVDDLGNINDTWENDTARTKPSPDTTSPASVADLQNITYEQTCINWTWTDPDDADFAKVMVYLDGTYKEGVLKEVQCYNATGLTPDTEYTIGTRTVDDLGNINDTWENDTARTKPGAALELNLIIETITPNCGGYLFGNESNNISAVVKNIGTGSACASNASFVLSDGYSETVSVGALASGASETVTITDPTIRAAGAAVTITVTADCDDEIAESNEANNATVLDVTVLNNGYKGKTYTGGSNMTTWKSYDLHGNLVYSVGDSYYLSGSSYPHWTTYNASWDTSDLPVTGTVVEARLYTTYTWDKDGVMLGDVTMSFSGVVQTLEAHYWDDRTFPDSKPYGMLAYNVTDDFNTGGNYANLTNSHTGGGNVSMRGMLLVAIYENASEPQRLIYVNEEFDLLYGGPSKCTTPEEATAWAPITGSIDTSIVADATLITVAPGAGPNEGELIFNGQVWNDVWSFAGANGSQIGIDERDVKLYLESNDNLVGFRSSEDWMEASNAFLVVEYSEVPISCELSGVGRRPGHLKNSGDLRLTARAKNTCASLVYCQMEWQIKDGSGTVVATVRGDNFTEEAGNGPAKTSKLWTVDLDAGSYTVTGILHYGATAGNLDCTDGLVEGGKFTVV